MGFNHPGNHAEQRKNLSIACTEGYGDEIRSWDTDVITFLDKKKTKPPLPNGLPLFIEKVRSLCS
ncbi:MAG: hypothetical protein JXA44_10210 [Methanospirillaceae archaeon]|nr:hypothetical protein [Methanospirillaceae archaeon]